MTHPYVFPTLVLVGATLRYLQRFQLLCTMVILDVLPRKYWWPILQYYSTKSYKLASRGDCTALLSPSKIGLVPHPCLPGDLWAFLVVFWTSEPSILLSLNSYVSWNLLCMLTWTGLTLYNYLNINPLLLTGNSNVLVKKKLNDVDILNKKLHVSPHRFIGSSDHRKALHSLCSMSSL